jgi:hypothetical protein
MRNTPSPSQLLVFTGAIEDGAGRPIEKLVIPMLVPMPKLPRIRRARELVSCIALSARARSDAKSAAIAWMHRRVAVIAEERDALLACRRCREALVDAAMSRRFRQPAVQPALFDNRELERARRSAERAGDWDDLQKRARDTLSAAAHLVSGDPELMLVMVTV